MANIELLEVNDAIARKHSVPWSTNDETLPPSTAHSNIQTIRGQNSLAPLRPGTASKAEEGDSNAVAWDGPDDPQNPQNWPQKRKWSNLIALSIMTFLT